MTAADKSNMPVCNVTQMADSSSPTELQQNNSDDALELNKDLENMIEGTENMSGMILFYLKLF